MTDLVRITLEPLGERFEVRRGSALQDVLFSHGLEFPCGGRGQCKGCRVRVLQGHVPVTPDHQHMLTAEELAAGWRLACCCQAESDLTLEVLQWRGAVLTDNSPFEFTPREGFGIAVDVGTTTLAAQLVDLRTGRVRAVRTALNPQAQHGADVMSRVQFAVSEDGHDQLEALIRNEIGKLTAQLSRYMRSEDPLVDRVVLVGNTVMHHLFCGIDLEPLSRYPFEPSRDGLERFRASELGWTIPGDPEVLFLPCLGGFVGSDILAGILACNMRHSDELTALIDLGTNGEIVVGTRERMLCASTAAGPAFEGARIAMGMRASAGAVARVHPTEDGFGCYVLGNVAPRGICGSGLVDAVAAGLDNRSITPSGRLADGKNELMLVDPVHLTQCDVRELQLAKGAIAAGVHVLLNRLASTLADVRRVSLAGALGNYINRSSARRIGLLDFPPQVVQSAGNTALLGAKIALFADRPEHNEYTALRGTIEHVPLAADKCFQDLYIQSMPFPDEPA